MKFASLLILCMSTFALAQSNPVPLVNNPLVPGSAVPGGQDFQLTVNGTGFVSASAVQWNGQALSTTFVSASQLKATVPAADIAVAGTASVTVKNPSPGGGVSNGVLFEVRAPFPSVSFGRSAFNMSLSYRLVAADFNHDGIVDIACLTGFEADVSVLLGKGDGTFAPVNTYPVGDQAADIIDADFNGDGNLDLAVVDSDSNNGFVSVLLGNGDGTFQPRKDSYGFTWASFLIAGDFNRDGKPDLAVSIGFPTGDADVMIGNGDGTFQAPVPYLTGIGAQGLATGDFNRDGKLDLAVCDGTGDGIIAILLGNGDGTLGTANSYIGARFPRNVIAADFNGDGNLDLAVESNEEGVSVMLGLGDGTFPTHIDFRPKYSALNMGIGDLNGDGIPDIAIPLWDKKVYVYKGRGDGTFTQPNPFPTNDRPMGIVLGDLNGDGRLDILTSNQESTMSEMLQTPLVLSRTFVDFKKVKVGSKAKQYVIISNIGTQTFSIRSIAVTGVDADAFSQTNNCIGDLGPSMTCKIRIVFKPFNGIKYKRASIEIHDTAVSVVQRVYLLGKGEN